MEKTCSNCTRSVNELDIARKENEYLKQEVERLKHRVRELNSKLLGVYKDNAKQVRYEMDYLPPPDDEFDR